MTKFIHLRNHTEYSLCSGAIKLKKAMALSKDKNIPAVCITDSHNMFGALEFSIACCKSGLQPIVGCETIVDCSNFLFSGSRSIQTNAQKEECLCKMVLIAKTDEGFLNLIALVSDSYLNRKDGITPNKNRIN